VVLANKRTTRLRHVQSEGHIDVANAGGVIVARVSARTSRDLFYHAEKFMGRLVAWFEDELTAINQFLQAMGPKGRPVKKR
jgi:hypothetical protein